MRIVKHFVIIIIMLLLLFSAVVCFWAVWERNRDPLSAIDYKIGKIIDVQDSIYFSESLPKSRTYTQIIFTTEKLGKIEAYLSLPDTIPQQGLPVVIILGGLEIGIENFNLIQNPGYNAVIIYQYPYSPRYWYEGTAISQIPQIRHAALIVPAQVLALSDWALKQNWASSTRPCVLGYSFGAMFLPAIYHLADFRQYPLNSGVIAYAGADIYDLLKTNLRKISQPFKSIFAWLAATAIYPLEPAEHLPFMNNEFLIINGTQDHQISEYSWKKLHELIPEPKTIVILDEGHMHPRKPDLTKKLVNISKDWLVERGVINP